MITHIVNQRNSILRDRVELDTAAQLQYPEVITWSVLRRIKYTVSLLEKALLTPF